MSKHSLFTPPPPWFPYSCSPNPSSVFYPPSCSPDSPKSPFLHSLFPLPALLFPHYSSIPFPAPHNPIPCSPIPSSLFYPLSCSPYSHSLLPYFLITLLSPFLLHIFLFPVPLFPHHSSIPFPSPPISISCFPIP